MHEPDPNSDDDVQQAGLTTGLRALRWLLPSVPVDLARVVALLGVDVPSNAAPEPPASAT
jgi:hypothetical protein